MLVCRTILQPRATEQRVSLFSTLAIVFGEVNKRINIVGVRGKIWSLGQSCIFAPPWPGIFLQFFATASLADFTKHPVAAYRNNEQVYLLAARAVFHWSK